MRWGRAAGIAQRCKCSINTEYHELVLFRQQGERHNDKANTARAFGKGQGGLDKRDRSYLPSGATRQTEVLNCAK